MAADSIAKLSIIITGDASPLTNELRKAEGNITGFSARLGLMRSTAPRFGDPFRVRAAGLSQDAARSREAVTLMDRSVTRAADSVRRFTSSGSSGMSMLTRNILLARAATAGMNGNVLALTAGMAKLGIVGAGAAVVVGLGMIAKKAIEARDALAVGRGEDSIAGAWAKVGSNLSSILSSLSEITGFYTFIRNATQAWAHDLKAVAEALKTDEMRKQDAFWKRRTEFLKEQKRLAEEQAAAHKEASEQMARFMDDMRGRAERVNNALRTPGEIFADTVNELNSLFQLGLVGVENYKRGVRQARGDLADAAKSAAATAKSFRDMAYRPVGAAERFTQAGASAVASGRAELQRLAEIQRQQLAIEKAQLKAQEEGNRLLKEKKPIVFTKGSF